MDLQANDEYFAVAHHHITVGELHFAFAQRFDLPAFKHQARFKSLFEKIVESRLFIVGNAGGGIGFFGHGAREKGAA